MALSSSFSLRSSLRQHGKQHTKGKEDKNRIKEVKKVEGGTDDMRVKEVTLDEKPGLVDSNTTSEDCLGGVKENGIEETGADEAVVKTTEVVVKSTAKPLILHSTLC